MKARARDRRCRSISVLGLITPPSGTDAGYEGLDFTGHLILDIAHR